MSDVEDFHGDKIDPRKGKDGCLCGGAEAQGSQGIESCASSSVPLAQVAELLVLVQKSGASGPRPKQKKRKVAEQDESNSESIIAPQMILGMRNVKVDSQW